VTYDADCDGALVGVDCDDADVELGDPAFDADGGQLCWGERATIWQADYYLPVTGVEYETIENLGDLDGDGHVELRVADTVVWGPLLP